jgi:hypothetical protein
MRVITIIRTAPIGVLIMLIMEPVAPLGISDPPITETATRPDPAVNGLDVGADEDLAPGQRVQSNLFDGLV